MVLKKYCDVELGNVARAQLSCSCDTELGTGAVVGSLQPYILEESIDRSSL